MATINTDYLRFDAYSIKNKIIQKLSDNSTFTDQIFEDSNLSTLIDVFAYMFEVLTYYTNHGSSEAIFTDATLYENMNRIVKMLGYNPVGYVGSKTNCSIIQTESSPVSSIFDDNYRSKILPRYAYVNTGLTDSNGKPIYYSSVSDFTIQKSMPATSETTYTFYNGRWRLYDRTFMAAGNVNEEFLLDLIDLEKTYVSHPYVHVYVKRNNAYYWFTPVAQGTLFGNGFSIVSPTDDVFELRINENKRYTIKFGDGIHGSKLEANDEIYIVYLESNGTDGKIGSGIINESSDKIKYGIAGLDQSFFNSFLNIDSSTGTIISDGEAQRLYVKNINSSSVPASLETVDSIRKNAPDWFRMNGRLISAQDFKQYVLSTYASDIYDCYVMNNWEYMASFQNWLNTYSALTIEIKKNDYMYADSCDFNNVYVWTKFKYAVDKWSIEQDMIPRKVLTCEPVILDAFDVSFIPCYKNTDSNGVNKYLLDNWDPNMENWIEILKDKNSFVPAEKIKKAAIDTIKNYFKAENQYLGTTVDFDALYASLMAINGVKSVKMAYRVTGAADNTTQYFNGISFAVWTKKIINGADLTIVSSNKKLEDFQFPVLVDDLDTRIKLTYDSIGQRSVEY